LKEWKDEHPKQNLIVPANLGCPNGKLLRMVKRLARRAGIECGWCPNCIAGVKGERGCDEIEVHKFGAPASRPGFGTASTRAR
jgi:hypothetical protein